jgi:hypothetical protein
MDKIEHNELNGTLFPITYIDGIAVVDYPSMEWNKQKAKAITKEGKRVINNLSAELIKLAKEKGYKINLNSEELKYG